MVNGVLNCAKIPLDTDNKALYLCLILNDGKMCEDFICVYNVPPSMVDAVGDVED